MHSFVSCRFYLQDKITEREKLLIALAQIKFTDAHTYQTQNDALKELLKTADKKIDEALNMFTIAQNEYTKCSAIFHKSRLRGHRRYKKKAENDEKRIVVETS